METDSKSYGMLQPEKPKNGLSKSLYSIILVTSVATAIICTGLTIAYLSSSTCSKNPNTNMIQMPQISELEDVQLYAEMFHFWKSQYKKEYESEMEELRRLAIFTENYKKINEWNKQSDQTSSVALNQFADMTSEEFAAQLKRLSSQATFDFLKQSTPTVDFAVGDLPNSVDWRAQNAVTPIKNQGGCGGCWAFAAAAGLESLSFIKGNKLESFSEQQLIDCAGNCDGCGGCANLYNALEYTKSKGIESYNAYPFTQQDGTCEYDASKVVFKNEGYELVKPKSADQLKAALVNQPVLVGVQANQFAFQFYSGGVLSNGFLCGDQMDHAIVAVGYGTHRGQDAFIVRNSWGTGWGEDGYVYISTSESANGGNGVCGILSAPVYPTA